MNTQPKAELLLRQKIEALLKPVDEIIMLQTARGYPYIGPNVADDLMALISTALKELEGMIPEKYTTTQSGSLYWKYNQAIDQTHQAFTTYREREGL